jgi:hypothetical protein
MMASIRLRAVELRAAAMALRMPNCYTLAEKMRLAEVLDREAEAREAALGSDESGVKP